MSCSIWTRCEASSLANPNNRNIFGVTLLMIFPLFLDKLIDMAAIFSLRKLTLLMYAWFL